MGLSSVGENQTEKKADNQQLESIEKECNSVWLLQQTRHVVQGCVKYMQNY